MLSYACAIPDIMSETVLLTGGYQPYSYSTKRVTRYGRNGWIEDLPSMTTGRYNHACGYFINSHDELVNLK